MYAVMPMLSKQYIQVKYNSTICGVVELEALCKEKKQNPLGVVTAAAAVGPDAEKPGLCGLETIPLRVALPANPKLHT